LYLLNDLRLQRFFEVVQHFEEGDGVAGRGGLVEQGGYFLLVVGREGVLGEVVLVDGAEGEGRGWGAVGFGGRG
jgi:hypothetical protein